jgi:hypothetical protein
MTMKNKLAIALCAYAGLGLLAWLTLEGELRWIVWVLMGALAVKTWVAAKRQE